MSGFSKVVTEAPEDPILPDPSDPAQQPQPLQPQKSQQQELVPQTTPLKKTASDLEKFPSLKKLLGSKASPEVRKSISTFQSKRMSTADFMLESENPFFFF